MRVLVAGDWHSDLHETEVCKSLRRLGHEALEFKWFHYFQFDPRKSRSVGALVKRLQNKFVIGPIISRLNDDFLSQVRSKARPYLRLQRDSLNTNDASEYS